MNFWDCSRDELYQHVCETESDINQFLPTLRRYASMSEHVTEFGVRTANSTCALLAGQPKTLVCYDIAIQHQYLENLARVRGDTILIWHEANVLNIDIAPTDLLFIDTLHTYGQLKAELGKHAEKVRKFLIFHDTWGYRNKDEGDTPTDKKGLWPAIEEFLESNPQWKIVEDLQYGWGLTVLKT